MNQISESFLNLIRLGIDHNSSYGFTSCIDWDKIEALAIQHGLSAVLVDGVELLPEGKRPPKEVLLQWIGETLQGYEYRYKQYKNAIAGLASFYNSNGFKMMVLKGYACSLDWPKPSHRPCGDIDIWLFGKQKEADVLLAKEKGIVISRGHHHHTVFGWHDFTVENHYDFINVNRHKSHSGLEKIFKELGADDTHSVEINGEKVYLPSPSLHALFLLRHALNHFASMGINLRQVLDWAFFIEKHSEEIDWDWFLSIIDEYHMREFFNCLNAICVENLGIEVRFFKQVQFNPTTKEKVLNDILAPEFSSDPPKGLFNRLSFRCRRWRGSAWKYELCYNESMWSAFWSGVKSHLLKPSIAVH